MAALLKGLLSVSLLNIVEEEWQGRPGGMQGDSMRRCLAEINTAKEATAKEDKLAPDWCKETETEDECPGLEGHGVFAWSVLQLECLLDAARLVRGGRLGAG